MGFDRAFPPGTRVEGALAQLAAEFAARGLPVPGGRSADSPP
jgi:hypothetical protein